MATATEHLRVLFVDDDDVLRGLAEQALRKAQMTVATASNGHEALARLEKATFDVAVIDIVMPEKEGLETIMEIRQRWPQLGVLAITGGGKTGSGDFLAMASAFGAHATLRKPFDMHEVVMMIPAVHATAKASVKTRA